MNATTTIRGKGAAFGSALAALARARVMRRIRRGAVRIAIAAVALLAPLPGQAAIQAAQSTVQPATTIVAIGQANSIVLNWTIVSIFAGPGTYTVTSLSGQFMSGATVLGTVNTVLSVSGTTSGPPSSVRLLESLLIPPDILIRANRLGVASITYVRQFNDGGGPVAFQANLLIGGSSAGQFGIFREALSFDDGSAVRVVRARDPLAAVAEINFSGSGAMSAVWEVAGPSTTAGQPVFRELQPVTRGLIGGEPAIFRSIPLPTDSLGVYTVRLRITNPPPGFDPPVLSYYVGDARSGAFGGVTAMTVMGPADRAILDRDTRFAWQPVEGAKAYKIEVFASPGTDPFDLPDLSGTSTRESDPRLARAALSAPPVSGMVVAAAQTQVALSSVSRVRLQSRRSYFWRVQAIGADGTVIGEGRVQQFRIP
jgi:hypothetical protein